MSCNYMDVLLAERSLVYSLQYALVTVAGGEHLGFLYFLGCGVEDYISRF